MKNYKKNTLLEAPQSTKRNWMVLFLGLFMMIFIVNSMSAFDWVTDISGYYKFDETSGSVVSEEVAEKNLTAINSPTWETGIINNALNFTSGSSQFAFNGTNHYYTLGGNEWSISAWVYPYSITGNQIIAIAQENWALRLSGDEVAFSVIANQTNAWQSDMFSSGASILTENWYHTVVTYNGSTSGVKIYVNGNLQTIAGSWFANSIPKDIGDGSFRIGGDNVTSDYNGAYFNGKIDEMGIFNRTLDASEVLELYNSGSGLPYEDATAGMTINLVKPSNDTTLVNLTNNNFTATYNSSLPGLDLINTTYWIWWANGTVYNNTHVVLLSGEEDVSEAFFNFSELNDYLWNVYACMGDGVPANCSFASQNYTFNVGHYKENSVTYDTPTVETTSETFTLNITIGSGVTLDDADFYYNGTTYSPSISSTGDRRVLTNTITVPEVSVTTNFTFFWMLELNNGSVLNYNTTEYNQTVNILEIDNCTINTHKILNYSIFDEDNRSFLDNSTWNVSANVFVKLTGDFSGETYNYYSAQLTTNSINICIADALVTGQNYRLDSEIQYSTAGHVTEYYYTENYTLNIGSSPLNISLYNLAIDRSQEFLINYKDEYYTPSSGALIHLKRQYLELGDESPLTVEVVKTDNDGSTIGHFVLNDEVYDIYVYKNGVLEAVFLNQRAFCSNIATGDCRINLNAAGITSSAGSFTNYLGVDYSESYDSETKIYTMTYNIVDGSTKTMLLNITKWDVNNNVTICTDTEVSSLGVLSCTIPSAYYQDTLYVRTYVDGVELGVSIIPATVSRTETLGTSRYILAFFLLLTIPLLVGSSGVITLVFFFLGLIAAGSLALIDFSYFGVGSLMIWILIAGGVIWWKANKD